MRENNILFWLISLIATGPLSADVLLLRNGNSIQGAIQRTRDGYVVRTSEGGTIHVPRRKVQMYAKSLEKIYQWKLRRTGTKDIKGHVRLANWCVQEGLSDRAVSRLLYLSRIAPDAPVVRSLERQLRNQAKRKNGALQRISNPALQEIDAPAAGDENLPMELTEHAVREFRRVVQPLLINRCGQASCHGPAAKSDFRLIHFKNLRPNRELTLRNLNTTARFVSKEPSESQLLQKASQLHGQQTRLAFEAKDIKTYRRLEQWVFRLVGVEESSAPETAETKNATPPADEAAGASHGQVQERADNQDRQMDDGPLEEQVPRPKNAPSSSVADPFDPQEFNRRFRRQTK